MKLNKILLGCILFACAANSTEFKLESTTGGDYFKVKGIKCKQGGSALNPKSKNPIMCDFTITAKQEIKILDIQINKNIPKKSNKCSDDMMFHDWSKSSHPLIDGIVDRGEVMYYSVPCTKIDNKNPLKTITIITDKNKATYKNPNTYLDKKPKK